MRCFDGALRGKFIWAGSCRVGGGGVGQKQKNLLCGAGHAKSLRVYLAPPHLPSVLMGLHWVVKVLVLEAHVNR